MQCVSCNYTFKCIGTIYTYIYIRVVESSVPSSIIRPLVPREIETSIYSKRAYYIMCSSLYHYIVAYNMGAYLVFVLSPQNAQFRRIKISNMPCASFKQPRTPRCLDSLQVAMRCNQYSRIIFNVLHIILL